MFVIGDCCVCRFPVPFCSQLGDCRVGQFRSFEHLVEVFMYHPHVLVPGYRHDLRCSATGQGDVAHSALLEPVQAAAFWQASRGYPGAKPEAKRVPA